MLIGTSKAGIMKPLGDLMRPMTPCLLAEYANSPGDSLNPAMEETRVIGFSLLPCPIAATAM